MCHAQQRTRSLVERAGVAQRAEQGNQQRRRSTETRALGAGRLGDDIDAALQRGGLDGEAEQREAGRLGSKVGEQGSAISVLDSRTQIAALEQHARTGGAQQDLCDSGHVQRDVDGDRRLGEREVNGPDVDRAARQVESGRTASDHSIHRQILQYERPNGQRNLNWIDADGLTIRTMRDSEGCVLTKPVIGISCSTLVLPGMRGVPRFALVHGYVDCVLAAGGLPLLFPNVDPAEAPAYLDQIDGLILSGGLDVDPYHYDHEPHPKLGQVDAWRDAFELALIKHAHTRRIPTLAICRGVQVMNIAFGGTLVQDIESSVEKPLRHSQRSIQQDQAAHSIQIEPDSQLSALVRESASHATGDGTHARVNTYHHQSCDRVASGFRVSAYAPDGVIEAIELDPKGDAADHPFCIGVQWHPERLPQDGLTQALFSGLIVASREDAAKRARAAHDGAASPGAAAHAARAG